ncbi:hypothetical protein G9A89_000335 [Geosiphon pyriformis]|nr:hypothetical protein G9A89_000335 [Geosiphon pyriformis]
MVVGIEMVWYREGACKASVNGGGGRVRGCWEIRKWGRGAWCPTGSLDDPMADGSKDVPPKGIWGLGGYEWVYSPVHSLPKSPRPYLSIGGIKDPVANTVFCLSSNSTLGIVPYRGPCWDLPYILTTTMQPSDPKTTTTIPIIVYNPNSKYPIPNPNHTFTTDHAYLYLLPNNPSKYQIRPIEIPITRIKYLPLPGPITNLATCPFTTTMTTNPNHPIPNHNQYQKMHKSTIPYKRLRGMLHISPDKLRTEAGGGPHVRGRLRSKAWEASLPTRPY